MHRAVDGITGSPVLDGLYKELAFGKDRPGGDSWLFPSLQSTTASGVDYTFNAAKVR